MPTSNYFNNNNSNNVDIRHINKTGINLSLKSKGINTAENDQLKQTYFLCNRCKTVNKIEPRTKILRHNLISGCATGLMLIINEFCASKKKLNYDMQDFYILTLRVLFCCTVNAIFYFIPNHMLLMKTPGSIKSLSEAFIHWDNAIMSIMLFITIPNIVSLFINLDPKYCHKMTGIQKTTVMHAAWIESTITHVINLCSRIKHSRNKLKALLAENPNLNLY